MKRGFREGMIGAVVSLAALVGSARGAMIESYGDIVEVTPYSQIVWLNDGGLMLDGAVPEYAVTIGFENKHGVLAGFLDSSYNAGRPSAGSGLWYKADGSLRGFELGDTYVRAEARVDWDGDGWFSENEIAAGVEDGGFRNVYTGVTTRIVDLNVVSVPGVETILALGGLGGLGLFKRKQKRAVA